MLRAFSQADYPDLQLGMGTPILISRTVTSANASFGVEKVTMKCLDYTPWDNDGPQFG